MSTERPAGAVYKLQAIEIEPVRFRRHGARRVFRESGIATAAQIIGPIVAGDDICGEAARCPRP